MKSKKFLTAFSTLLCTILLAAQAAQAECMGPLCHNMHTMSLNLDCLQKKMPAFLCEKTSQDEVTSLKTNAEQARELLLKDPKFDDSQRAEITQLFDQLLQAIDQLSQAADHQDQTAQDAAIKAISDVRKKGHLDFKD
jgi:soluble cytochrome b562